MVADLTLEAPLVLPDQGSLELQVVVGEGERREIGIYTRSDEDAPWVRHAAGVLAPGDDDVPELTWPPAGAEELPVESLYDRLADMGFDYGPQFQAVGAAWRRGEEVFADVTIEDADRYGIHPALFDALFHAAIDTLTAGGEPGTLQLPFAFSGVRLAQPGVAAVRAAITPLGDGGVALTAADAHGRPVLAVRALSTRPVDAALLAKAGGQAAHPLYEVAWNEIEDGDEAAIFVARPGRERETHTRPSTPRSRCCASGSPGTTRRRSCS